MSQPKTKSKEKPSVDASVGKPVATVSRETLEDTPGRALSLLRAIGTSKLIRAAMADVGYETKDHQEGWELLHGVSGFAEDKPVEAVDSSVRDAILALDRWDEDGFRTVRATLTRRFPEQAAFVLDGIGPAEGPAAVLGVKACARTGRCVLASRCAGLDALRCGVRRDRREGNEASLDPLPPHRRST